VRGGARRIKHTQAFEMEREMTRGHEIGDGGLLERRTP